VRKGATKDGDGRRVRRYVASLQSPHGIDGIDGYQSVTLYGKALVIRGILSRRSGGRGIGNLRRVADIGRFGDQSSGFSADFGATWYTFRVFERTALEILPYDASMVSSRLGQGVAAVQIRAASHIQCRKTGSHMYGNNSHTHAAAVISTHPLRIHTNTAFVVQMGGPSPWCGVPSDIEPTQSVGEDLPA
jgi:hypothetical protein